MCARFCHGPKDKLKNHLWLCSCAQQQEALTVLCSFRRPLVPALHHMNYHNYHETLDRLSRYFMTLSPSLVNSVTKATEVHCRSDIFHAQVLAILNVILSGVDELRWLNFWMSLINWLVYNLNNYFQNYILCLWGNRENMVCIMRCTFLPTINRFLLNLHESHIIVVFSET